MPTPTLDDYILNPKSGLPIVATPERLADFSVMGITPKKLSPSKYRINPKTGKPNKIVAPKIKLNNIKQNEVAPVEAAADLPNNVLRHVAEHANSKTKEAMRLVNKSLRNSIVLSPGIGKKNYKSLMTFLKSSDAHLTLYVDDPKDYSLRRSDIEYVDVVQKYNPKTKKERLTFTRYKTGELPEIIGAQEYNSPEEINLTKTIKKGKQPYFAKLINGKLESVRLTGYYNRQPEYIQEWNKQITASKN